MGIVFCFGSILKLPRNLILPPKLCGCSDARRECRTCTLIRSVAALCTKSRRSFIIKYPRFLEYLKTTVVGADGENAGRVAETEREKIGGPCDGLVDGVVDGVDACRIACFLAHA